MKTRFDGATPPFALALWLILTTAIYAQEAPSGETGQADSAAQADTSAQTDTSAQSDASTGSQSDAQSQTDASADTSANTNQNADSSASTSNDTSANQADAQSETQATAETDTTAGDASAEARGGAQTDSANRQTGAQQNNAQRRGLPAPNQSDAGTERDTRARANTQQDARGDADVDADANVDAEANVDADANADADAHVDADARQRDARDRDGRDRDARGRDGRRDFRGHIRFGRATRGGILIDTVVRDSIFFRAGLRQGDIIVSIQGRPIRNDADFHRWVVYNPGRPVPVVILRDGRQETIYVTYEDDMADADVVYEEQPIDMQGYLGVSFDANARNAAIVSVVAPNSPAEHAGLRQGDMIVALNGQPVDSYQQAIEIIASMRPGDRLGIDFARRQEDKTQAVLASKPGRGPRAAALPRDEVRVYQEDRANISIEENQVPNNQRNDRRLLNREPVERRSGDRPLLPRLRN